jgi:nitrogen PTS system EIIA component
VVFLAHTAVFTPFRARDKNMSVQAGNEIRFSDILREENVICNLKAGTRDEALAELIHLLHRNTGGFNAEAALRDVLGRENIAPTVVSPGIALPHLRLAGLPGLLLAVGTSVAGVDFHRREQGPVHAIFLVLTPRTDPDAYLQFVAGLSRKLIPFKEVRLLAGCTSPEELCAMLSGGPDDFPSFLSARHVMDPHPPTLLESDHLGTAIDTFCERRVTDIPVVDEQGDVRGVVSLEDLLRLSLPEHLLWMEDLTPIIQFEPFADLLRREREMKLADFMREKYVHVSPEVPAIQLAKTFIIDDVRQILVMEGRKLVGVVNLRSFVSKLFWA